MLKFIINFLIYGIIFYLIWKFQPAWIDVLRSWADAAYDVVINLANIGLEKIKELSANTQGTTKS